MANFFNNPPRPGVSEREALETRYQSFRHEILFIVVCTVINIVLLLTHTDRYVLFSAYVPYFMVFTGMLLCGKLPAEYYEGLDGLELFDSSILVVMLVLAAIGLGIYMLCWIFSKKRAGWLWVALVLISLDTVGLFLLAGFDMSMLVDYIFHGLVIFYLIMGIITHKKLKALPAEDEPIEAVFVEAEATETETTEE